MSNNVWVVCLYADYRKETDSTVVRAFSDELKAIYFADSFSSRQPDEPLIKKDNEYVLPCPGALYDRCVVREENIPPTPAMEEILARARPSWGLCYARIAITKVPFE
jgi:hypothetical protein